MNDSSIAICSCSKCMEILIDHCCGCHGCRRLRNLNNVMQAARNSIPNYNGRWHSFRSCKLHKLIQESEELYRD